MNQHDGTFQCFVGDTQMFQLYQQYYIIIVWVFYACSRQLMAEGWQEMRGEIHGKLLAIHPPSASPSIRENAGIEWLFG